MDNDYVNIMPAEPEPSVPAAWRDIAAPVLAIVLSVLYWAVFSAERVFALYGPGLGVPVFVLAYFAVVLTMLGKRARRSAGGACLMAAAIVLSLCCALYAYTALTVLNCFIILITAAAATFSLSGQMGCGAFDIRAAPEAVRLSVFALFGRVDGPFKVMRGLAKGRRGSVGRVVLSVLVSVLVLTVVLALLASADMVFGSFFAGIRGWLAGQAPSALIWKITRTAGLALFIASGLYFIREPASAAAKKERAEREPHAAPFLLPALLLDAVYIIFCAVQVRYLFGGAQTAAMAGGWAAYARTGFFQLAAVAVINLAVCLLGADARRFAAKGGLALRIADGLMLALTAVILLSAARRMQLYILAFGMSVLRLMTLWGMLVIAAGLLAAAWKLFRPAFSFWRVFSGFALGTWCLFCLCGPAGRVADYNVDAYLDGRLESVDVYYLQSLSPDAAGALERLIDASDNYDGEARDALDALARDAYASQTSWAVWKASFLRVG